MPSLQEVDDFLFENLSDVKTSRGSTHFNARCPICGDSKKSLSKKRFHLQFEDEDSIYWNCFNCNQSGTFYQLYSYLTGVTEKEAWKQFNTYSSERVVSRIVTKKKKKPTVKANKDTFDYILNDCLAVDSAPKSYLQDQYLQQLKQFICNRKIKQDVFVAYKGEYQGRIIVPVYDKNNIVYFQGRRINEKMIPKYLNPVCNKQQIVLNKDNFDINKKIVITEGIIDADAIGSQGTCMLGKELNKSIFRDLYYKYKQGIVLVMDNDEDGMNKLFEYMKQYKNMCKYFLMPNNLSQYKDLNELLVNNINTGNMYDFVVGNSYSYIQVEMHLKLKK